MSWNNQGVFYFSLFPRPPPDTNYAIFFDVDGGAEYKTFSNSNLLFTVLLAEMNTGALTLSLVLSFQLSTITSRSVPTSP